jgi:hypothetical protein
MLPLLLLHWMEKLQHKAHGRAQHAAQHSTD